MRYFELYAPLFLNTLLSASQPFLSLASQPFLSLASQPFLSLASQLKQIMQYKNISRIFLVWIELCLYANVLIITSMASMVTVLLISLERSSMIIALPSISSKLMSESTAYYYKILSIIFCTPTFCDAYETSTILKMTDIVMQISAEIFVVCFVGITDRHFYTPRDNIYKIITLLFLTFLSIHSGIILFDISLINNAIIYHYF